MSITYKTTTEQLGALIQRATQDATYVIPDLQRPYVWTPRQVTLLIDSLFRGWPFGTLLLWEVRSNAADADHGIPSRPFWQVVDRTGQGDAQQAHAVAAPATYQMVLDGQQRVQSLVLALNGDRWGFKMLDQDWAMELQERKVRRTEHWSRASLCLDLRDFQKHLKTHEGRVRNIEVRDILQWAVLERGDRTPDSDVSANYERPVEAAFVNPGRFIRLSRVWGRVQDGLEENEYEEIAGQLLNEHSALPDAELRRGLGRFMKLMETVKNRTMVYGLQIDSVRPTQQWTVDDYNNAIVNIFTRLNSAGRVLTNEEITFAWLKRRWLTAETDGLRADQCLAELKSLLEESDTKVEDDDLIRLLSFIWAVEQRPGGKLLDNKDLLNGKVIGTMASTISAKWRQLKRHITDATALLQKRGLLEVIGSFNSVIVFITLYHLLFSRVEAAGLRAVDKDSAEKELQASLGRFADRWMFATQWARTWGVSAQANFQSFAAVLAGLVRQTFSLDVASLRAQVGSAGSQLLTPAILDEASKHVEQFRVMDRNRVHQYSDLLWVWHRLDKERWECSAIPLRTSRRGRPKHEVDHTVADGWWQPVVEQQITAARAKVTDPLEQLKATPDGFASAFEARTYINSLGNCSMLEKTFNISKNKYALWSFLEQVYEFREKKMERARWEKALVLTSTLTEPSEVNFAAIVQAIKQRDESMRMELKEFVNGTRLRQDSVAS